jgi:hypothetical protein
VPARVADCSSRQLRQRVPVARAVPVVVVAGTVAGGAAVVDRASVSAR